MNHLVALVFLVGCGGYTIKSEKTDEVDGTCTFTAEFSSSWGAYEVGEQTVTVRPYGPDRRACTTGATVPCDDFRTLCTQRIGFRSPVYEAVREPVARE